FDNKAEPTGEGRAWRYDTGVNAVQLAFVGGDGFTSARIPYRISRHYNQAENALAVRAEIAGSGFASLFTVIALDPAGKAEPLTVEKHAVQSTFKGITFEDRLIEAVTIGKGGRRYT
ncbi:hypothetical protein J8J40_24335, partial [Mycobacterium tuberculosis]|nr:hypothetical protein [Mycobacterium tuberculosis]